MRLTVIPEDQTIIVDGVAYQAAFLSDPNIHAIQWRGDHGIVERKEGAATRFDALSEVQPYIDLWSAAHAVATAPPPPPTPEEAAALAASAAQAAALAAAKAEAKADNVVQYLRDHTPAECEQYVQDNVTDLASAKQLMKKFAIVLCVLSKQSLR